MLARVYGLTFGVLCAAAFSLPPLPPIRHFLGPSHAPSQQQPLHDTLDAWIDTQEQIALERLLANVAPGGRNVQGKRVAPGTVIASPSTDEPDYWYQCESSFERRWDAQELMAM